MPCILQKACDRSLILPFDAALLTSKRCILYIYSTNTGTEYFKHGIYSPFFFLFKMQFHNSNVFGSCFIHILYTVYAKIKKKNNSGAKRLNMF